MRLLIARVLRLLPGSISRRLARPSRWSRWILGLVLAAALELFGRVSPSDWLDGVGILAFSASAGLAIGMDLPAWKRRAVALRALRGTGTATPGSAARELRARSSRRATAPGALPWRVRGLAGDAPSSVPWARARRLPGAAREALRCERPRAFVYEGLLWSALAF
jgi:hypothetical protein